MHVLHQVRAAAVAALQGLALTGSRVFVQEPYSFAESTTPLLIVATSSNPEREYLGELITLHWEISIAVTAVVKGGGDLVAVLDAIASEVQGALCGIQAVNGHSVEVVPVSFDPPESAGEGDKPVMRRTVTFILQTLSTSAVDPDTLVD